MDTIDLTEEETEEALTEDGISMNRRRRRQRRSRRGAQNMAWMDNYISASDFDSIRLCAVQAPKTSWVGVMAKYWSQKLSTIVLRNLSVMACSVSASLVQSKILTHMIANLKVSALVKAAVDKEGNLLPNLSLVANVWATSNSLPQLLTSGLCRPHLLWVFCLTSHRQVDRKSRLLRFLPHH